MREAPAGPASHTAVQIPVRQIESGGPADPAGARALFDSILQWGILQPLIVRRIGDGPRYEVVAGAKRLASAVSAGFTEVPCIVFDGSEADAAAVAAASNISTRVPILPQGSPAPSPFVAAVLEELQATRSAIAASLRLTSAAGAGLRPRIARELVDVELNRTSWILDGLQILASEDAAPRTPFRLGPVLRSVIEAFQPECRLSAVDVQLLVEPADLVVAAAEADVRAAINCGVGALLTCMHAGPKADSTLAFLATEAPGAVVVSISQNVVPFQEVASLRSSTRRGELPVGDGVLTRFGLECARRAVERQGGRLELGPDPSTPGSTLTLKFASAGRRE
jgi:hypothetical protein